jgi:hypothetical protein
MRGEHNLQEDIWPTMACREDKGGARGSGRIDGKEERLQIAKPHWALAWVVCHLQLFGPPLWNQIRINQPRFIDISRLVANLLSSLASLTLLDQYFNPD